MIDLCISECTLCEGIDVEELNLCLYKCKHTNQLLYRSRVDTLISLDKLKEEKMLNHFILNKSSLKVDGLEDFMMSVLKAFKEWDLDSEGGVEGFYTYLDEQALLNGYDTDVIRQIFKNFIRKVNGA